MIDVSIIIVNYNVKQFLLQALDSVFKSQGVRFEVFVVDNDSTDNSMERRTCFHLFIALRMMKTWGLERPIIKL